jgi:hypothetical protein
MVLVTCPNCRSRIRAKDQLAGQTRKCPKCGQPITIRQDAADDAAGQSLGLDSAQPGEHAEPPSSTELPKPLTLDRLNRQFHYLICDRSKLVATWENDGKGWTLHTDHGTASAARNPGRLPSQGSFTLVELHLKMTDEGRRLSGLSCFQLAQHYALPALGRGDDEILSKITGPSGLSRDQKNVVRNVLKDQFMRDVWQDAAAVLEYLSNTDYHSPGA